MRGIQHAAAAVAAGAADHVLVYRSLTQATDRTHRPGQTRAAGGGPTQGYRGPYAPFGLQVPAHIYSLWFQRYMYRFGLTNEDFGHYSVVARRHAATNPAAYFYGRPITLEDHQRSRWIVEPILRLLDCCQTNDGAVALIVTTPERAADLPGQSVIVEATSQSHLRDGDELHDYYLGDRTEFAEATSLGRRLYEAAGLTPDDIDTAMIYENFSPLVFLQLEAFGFCGVGEARDFIVDGNIDLTGKLPVNTNGGLLGEAYIHGVNLVLEAVRQVRGTAANQVPDVEHAMVCSGRSALILGNG